MLWEYAAECDKIALSLQKTGLFAVSGKRGRHDDYYGKSIGKCNRSIHEMSN